MDKNKQVDFQPLSVGEQGTMIYIVQKLLNQLGYELEEDGVFSQEMEGVVKKFQETKETLKVDGVVGYETMKELDEESKDESC
jgi:peptidoglycan hydrolase-like protein with peptidoglycan-binding domain